ncbi:unnamed protein product [Rotaria magnacalcarata]|uniref:Uncharacterized protein n=1 Tax=Rotaria magnacalcarata TaxID=392030 RepID=A0A8S2LA89_9BILA|nr:unnamed protein product [Rotaria magnacalcarata]
MGTAKQLIHHLELINNNPKLLTCLTLAHLEYIQRNQHRIVFNEPTLFQESVNSSMCIKSSVGSIELSLTFDEYDILYRLSDITIVLLYIYPFNQLYVNIGSIGKYNT